MHISGVFSSILCPTVPYHICQPALHFLHPAAFCLDPTFLSCSLKSSPRQKAKMNVELISCVLLLSRISSVLPVVQLLKMVASKFCPGLYLLTSTYPFQPDVKPFLWYCNWNTNRFPRSPGLALYARLLPVTDIFLKSTEDKSGLLKWVMGAGSLIWGESFVKMNNPFLINLHLYKF